MDEGHLKNCRTRCQFLRENIERDLGVADELSAIYERLDTLTRIVSEILSHLEPKEN